MGSHEASAAGLRLRASATVRATPGLAAFAIAFAVTFAVALLQGLKPFYYDAGVYWSLADTFAAPGSFSLLNFDSPLRGYLLPLAYHGLQEAADALSLNHSTLAKLFNALVFALIATILAPRFAQLAWPAQRWGVVRRLGLAALLLVFWRGYLNFPLSDFPAVAAVLLALVAVARPTRPGWMLVAGLAAAAAINMRPAYLLLAPVLAVLVAFAWWRQRARPDASLRRWLACAGLLVLGFAAISLPQSLSAHRHHDTWSFVPGATAGLSSLQFTEGMRMQRYDTYVGTDAPGARMIFEDVTGARLLQREPGQTVVDARQYAGIVASHPATMSSLFARHVVNGLDQRYDTPYIERLDTGSNRWRRLAGFLIVFLALARVCWPAARRSLGPANWRYPVALLVCGATSIASAVETRFLLPTVLLAYLLALAPGWPNPLTASRSPGLARWRTPAVLGVALVAFMAVCLVVVSSATEHLRFG